MYSTTARCFHKGYRIRGSHTGNSKFATATHAGDGIEFTTTTNALAL